LETFARPLWGLTSLLIGGGEYEGAQRWIRGLAAGTDPKGPEYWGGAKAKDQRMVEMSPLSFAVAMKPDVFYEVNLLLSGRQALIDAGPNGGSQAEHCCLSRDLHWKTYA
jgi:hypothetical protein